MYERVEQISNIEKHYHQENNRRTSNLPTLKITTNIGSNLLYTLPSKQNFALSSLLEIKVLTSIMSERLINPYACSICFKTFSVSLNLVKHVELKHLSPNQPPIKVEPIDLDSAEEQCLNSDESKEIPR